MSMREIPRLRHQPPPVTSFAPLTMRHPPHEDVGGIKTADAVVLYAMTSRTIHTHKPLFRRDDTHTSAISPREAREF